MNRPINKVDASLNSLNSDFYYNLFYWKGMEAMVDLKIISFIYDNMCEFSPANYFFIISLLFKFNYFLLFLNYFFII